MFNFPIWVFLYLKLPIFSNFSTLRAESYRFAEYLTSKFQELENALGGSFM